MRYAEEPTSSFAKGMNDSAAATAYRRDEAAVIINGRIAPEGTVSVRKGSRRAHAAALNGGAQGYGGTVFVTTAGVVQWLAFVGAKAYVSINEGATWAQIATGLRTDYWSFAAMRVGAVDTLFCANGHTAMYSWDGTTWAAAAGVPAGSIRLLAVFNKRLVVAGHNGIVVQMSEVGVPSNFTTPDGLFLQINTDDGDNEITGLFDLSPHLMVFKRKSTAAVDGFGAVDLEVQAGATGLSRSVGCLAFRTIVAVGDTSVMWLSERGLERYSLANGLRLMSGSLRTFFAGLAGGTIADTPGLPCAIYLPDSTEYWCSVPTYAAKNDTTVILNLTTEAATLQRHAPAVGGGTVFVDADGYLQFEATPTRSQARLVNSVLTLAEGGQGGAYVGLDVNGYIELLENFSDNAALFVADRGVEVNTPVQIGYDGFVRWLEEGTLDDVASDGVPIGFRLVTRPLIFGDLYRRKLGRFLWVSVVAPDGALVYVNVIVDGRPRQTHALAFPSSMNGQPKTRMVRVNGKGTTVQVEVRTSDQMSLAGVALTAGRIAGVGS